MSSRPCVGCAWRPSPALMTWISGATWRAMRYGAPLSLWRTTNMSACIADEVGHRVEQRSRPWSADETLIARLITSADRRFAAISNVVRVRVEGSKKRLNTALPRSSGTFFTLRARRTMLAVSRICRRIAGGQSLERQQMVQLAVLVELRVRGVQATSAGLLLAQDEGEPLLRRRASARCSARRRARCAPPTNCAAIGSSRPPRSMSAASRMLAGRP